MSETAVEIDYNESVKPILKMMVDSIINNFNPIKIILFGSYARGTPNYDSDVDLLVIMHNGIDCRNTISQVLNSLAGTPIAKDVIVATPELVEKEKDRCNGVLHDAIKDGVVLYG